MGAWARRHASVMLQCTGNTKGLDVQQEQTKKKTTSASEELCARVKAAIELLQWTRTVMMRYAVDAMNRKALTVGQSATTNATKRKERAH